MAKLENLPVELLRMICYADALDEDVHSLKQLRLMNKTLRDLTTPRIFDEVYLGLFDYSIANLVSFSQSETLRRYPTTATFCGTYMRPMNFKRFEEHRPSSKTTDTELHAAWDRYKELALQQRKWSSDTSIVSTVAEAMSRFTNLETIMLPDATPWRVQERSEALWVNLQPQIFVLVGDGTVSAQDHPKDNMAMLHLLLSILPRCNQTLDDVVIAVCSPRFWEALHVGTLPPLPTSPFSNIQVLNLDISIGARDFPVVRTAAVRIASWLERTRYLRVLYLYIRNPQKPSCRVLKRLSPEALPSLEHLYMEIDATENEMITFFRHRKTVKTLNVDNCRLLNASWERTLTQLPRLLPDLTGVSTRGPLYEPRHVNPNNSMLRLLCYMSWQEAYDEYVGHKSSCPSFDADEWLPKEKVYRALHGLTPPWAPSPESSAHEESHSEGNSINGNDAHQSLHDPVEADASLIAGLSLEFKATSTHVEPLDTAINIHTSGGVSPSSTIGSLPDTSPWSVSAHVPTAAIGTSPAPHDSDGEICNTHLSSSSSQLESIADLPADWTATDAFDDADTPDNDATSEHASDSTTQFDHHYDEDGQDYYLSDDASTVDEDWAGPDFEPLVAPGPVFTFKGTRGTIFRTASQTPYYKTSFEEVRLHYYEHGVDKEEEGIANMDAFDTTASIVAPRVTITSDVEVFQTPYHSTSFEEVHLNYHECGLVLREERAVDMDALDPSMEHGLRADVFCTLYKEISFEEVRLEDYDEGRMWSVGSDEDS